MNMLSRCTNTMTRGCGSAGIFIDHSDNDDVCTIYAIIKGEWGHAVASLWRRHVPSCGLAIGPKHMSDFIRQ